MTANTGIDPALCLHEQLALASPDLMRELLGTFIIALLSAQADSVCGAEYGVRSDERTNRRNGYRHRELDTHAGALEVAVPKRAEAGPRGPVDRGRDHLKAIFTKLGVGSRGTFPSSIGLARRYTRTSTSADACRHADHAVPRAL